MITRIIRQENLIVTLRELFNRLYDLVDEHGDKTVFVMQDYNINKEGLENFIELQSDMKDVAVSNKQVIMIGQEID